MNKRGQALVMFIIMVPILLLLLAFIVDVGLMYNAKIKGRDMLKFAVKEDYDIEDYFRINDIEVEKLEEENNCYIINYKIDSIFGSLIGIKTYNIEVSNC